MDAKEYVVIELMGIERNVLRVMDTLTQQEIAWRPSCGCNSIGLILYHVARSDDSFTLPTLTGQKAVWETEKWCDRLGMPVTESGGQYTRGPGQRLQPATCERPGRVFSGCALKAAGVRAGDEARPV